MAGVPAFMVSRVLLLGTSSPLSTCEAGHEPGPNWIDDVNEHDRDRAGEAGEKQKRKPKTSDKREYDGGVAPRPHLKTCESGPMRRCLEI